MSYAYRRLEGILTQGARRGYPMHHREDMMQARDAGCSSLHAGRLRAHDRRAVAMESRGMQGFGEKISRVRRCVDTIHLDRLILHHGSNVGLCNTIMLGRGVIDRLGALLQHTIIICQRQRRFGLGET